MSMKPANTSLRLGLALGLGFLLLGLLSAVWTPYDISQLAVSQRLQGPSAQHWLGTDQLGRDVLSLLMKGAATSLGVAFVAVSLGACLGLPLGLWAAARAGWVDEAVMRAGDVVFAFPSLLLAILLSTWLGPGRSSVILAIAVFNVPVFARVVRAGALSLWARDFILAARVAGKGPLLISWQHLLPNLSGLLLVQLSIQFSVGLLAEAGLSYLGLGAQPPVASWGRMLAEAQTLTALAPSLALFPGLALVLAVLGFNLLGEGLRQHWDPQREAAKAMP
ncbi:peptide ABC transporter permease [Paucibacter sp. KBW04]|uniref:ABC transporter permease n=1 Tax=Paucibacter sp. KBW04 TaxID=2153361 RepID=UPI000F575420|nr:ABC transporter permease [Paucibacter sp. KBW04]RQO62494.1 peptide ABC transporter permease [Paucibacter sp. KBW04]